MNDNRFLRKEGMVIGLGSGGIDRNSGGVESIAWGDRGATGGIKSSSGGVRRDNSSRELSLRERFKRKGFGVVSYARAHNLSQPILSYVLDGKGGVTGKRSSGAVRKVYARLKADGVWVGPLPWESKK